MVKVVVAYCHELERCVSIDEARKEFFYLNENERIKFNFSCSDRQCDTLMSGVNYRVKAEDGKKYRAAHFRTPFPHKHKLGCEWLKFTEEIESPTKRENETESDFNERRARQKLNDWINYFDPAPDDDHQHIVDRPPNAQLNNLANNQANGNELNDLGLQKFDRYTRTNQLQRLIDTWMDAKKNLSQEEFNLLNITIRNKGKIPLGNYITPISRDITNEYEGVIYGGAVLKKRYGKGFLLHFYDKNNDKNIELYVSKDIMNNSRSSHYVDEVLNTDNVDYFQVFLLNSTNEIRETKDNKEVIQLKIDNLRNFAIYFKFKKTINV